MKRSEKICQYCIYNMDPHPHLEIECSADEDPNLTGYCDSYEKGI